VLMELAGIKVTINISAKIKKFDQLSIIGPRSHHKLPVRG